MVEQEYTYTPLSVDYQLNGRYQIQRILTQGGFSLVYIAWDHQLGKHVIVKEAAPSGMVVRDAALNIFPLDEGKATVYARVIENSLFEAGVLRDLTERGVTGITFYVADFLLHQTHYIVMDLATGRDIGEWNQSYREAGAPFPVDFLTHIIERTLHILKGVHEAGYYHCDIKPQNILVDDEGQVTLIDFGAVRTKEKQHDENVAISPGFSPPEFYPSHRALIGPATDLYMLAAMIYNLITRKVPEKANERAVRDRHVRLSAIPGLVDRYPASILSSVDKAMSVGIKDRFPDADTWLEFYEGVSQGRQIARSRVTANTGMKNGQVSAAAMARSRRKTGKGAALASTKPHSAVARRESGGGMAIAIFLLLLIAGGVGFYLMQQN